MPSDPSPAASSASLEPRDGVLVSEWHNPAGWLRFVDRLAHSCELHSLLVSRGEEPMLSATAAPWRATDQQLLYSLSKTFTSAAVGIAVERGALSYDDLVVDLFPDQVDERVGPKARSLRIRDLLAMASGHTGETADLVAGPDGRGYRRDAIGTFLRLEPEGVPGQTFAYNQPCTWICSRAVSERLGIDVLDLLGERVFPALGIERATWIRDQDGIPLGFSGFHLEPASIAAFFRLIAAGGVLDGEQLLATEWIERFSRPQVSTGEPDPANDWTRGYGWQVWIQRLGFRGDGYAGQYGIVLPEQNLSVAITSPTQDMQSVLDALWEEVVPGLDDAPDPEAAARLRRRLQGWTVPTPPTGSPRPWSGTIDGQGAELGLEPAPALRFIAGGRPVSVDLGQGSWADNRLTWGERTLDVAGALGEVDGHQVVHLAVRNSPHTRIIRLGADGEAAELGWNTQPLHALHLDHLAQEF